MSKTCFVLSTPDLSTNPLIEWLAAASKRPIHPIHPSQPLFKQNYVEDEDGHPDKNLTNALHHKLLNDLQKSWYEHLGTAASTIEPSKFEDELQAITAIILNNNCIFHSPLLCHFLPLYLPHLSPTNQQVAEPPTILLHFSAPLDCAINLQNSWRMPLSTGLALWESYIIQACRNIEDHDYRLISSKQISESDESELKDLFSYVSGDLSEDGAPTPLIDAGNFKIELPATKAQHLECLQSSQIEIAELLQQGDVTTIAARELCYSSADTLEYYGQVRGALETSNAARDSYKNKYITEMNKVEEVSTNAQSSPNTENSDGIQNTKEQIIDSTLCNVRVQIKGMDTLEFLSTVNSPVLEMLRTNLSNNNDELIYLNYGETGEETLYFMSSNLLSFETEPA